MKKINSKILLETQYLVKYILVVLFGLISLSSAAQLVARDGSSAANMPNMTFSGQYDVKMVAAPVLQPVWVKVANPLLIDRPLTDVEMLQDGKWLLINNEMSGSATDNSVVTALDKTVTPFLPAGDVGVAMVYADCDDDNTTFQSSAAFLDFGSDMACTTVQAAYLYWCGENSSDVTTYAPYPGTTTMRSYLAGGPVGTVTGYNTVKFKAPGDASYTTVTANRTLNTGNGEYQCFADVTKLVKGKMGGLYWVANVRNNSVKGKGGAKGGWNLVVIFTPPNCPPRVIKFWDGYIGNAGGNSVTMKFSAGQVPKSGNSVSYLGFTTFDAETDAGIIADKGLVTTPAAYGVHFTSSPGGTTKDLNPFDTDQPGVTVTSSKGVVVNNVQDGMASSRISTYDPTTDKNGNEITRLPSTIYTLGFGANHLKLPDNSMVPNATSATMTFPDDINGSYSTYMAYMAIETLQPNLKLALNTQQVQTGLSSTLSYVMTVKNIGPLASKPGASVLDTLPQTVNYVPGSAVFHDKSGNVLPQSAAPAAPSTVINNQGADVNEYLQFNLPAIAAGTGSAANDSITIKFDVQVQPLTRTDIWSYGCNRNIYNRATLIFKADDGTDLTTGSNSTAGCSGQGSYYNTPIVDAALDAQYKKTHNDSISLTATVNAANQAGTKVYIAQTVKQYLAAQLAILGLPATDISKYIVYNESGSEVLNTEYFTQAEAYQKYTAQADLGGGCIEAFYFTFLVAKVPNYTLGATTQPLFAKDASGEQIINISQGSPGYKVTVYDNSGTPVYSSCSASDYAFNVKGLKAGTYTFTVNDQGSIPATGSFTIPDALALTVSLGADFSRCKWTSDTLTATTKGRTGGINYIWEKSIDNPLTVTSTWTTVTGAVSSASTLTSTLINTTVDTTTYYRVIACDGNTQTLDTIKVTANPIPTVKLNSDTTVSTTINPMVTYHAKTKYIIGIPSFTWEMSTDNGSTWSPISSRVGESYTKVNDSTYSITGLDTLMSGYQYRVKVKDNSTTCESGTSAVKLTVTQGPKVIAESTKPSCFGLGDGKLAIHIKGGEPSETYTVTFTGPSPNMPRPVNYHAGPTGVADVVIIGPAGSYTVVLTPDPSGPYPGLQTQTKYFTIEDQAPVSLTLSSDNYEVCAGNNINLTANLTGGPDGATKTYIWEQSTDNGGSYSSIAGTASNIPFALDKSSVFRVIGMIGTCPDTSNTVAVAALPTPKASIVAVTDTGCYSFDLHNLQVVETTGINDYTVTLHSAAPKNTNDNRYLIPESDYIVTKNMTVYARLTVGGLCSSTAAGNVYIKKMDQCYPIAVPEFFSPDGDGINDLFQIDNLQAYDNPEIVVYDRYGKQVFKGGKEALTPPNGWDGKYISKDLPSGDYWYEMKFKEIKTKVGHFSIKRRKE